MSFDASISLNVQPREERGKNAARRLRASGMVPVTVYGGGNESVAGAINKRELGALLRAYGRNKIFNLNLDGGASSVKIADMQLDPIKGTLIHLDLMRISLTEKSEFEVTIKIVGEPEGVRTLGGILDIPTHSIKVRCLPTDLPDVIEVDVSKLVLGGHINVKDLQLGDKIEIRTSGEVTIATVVAPAAEEVAAPVEAAPAEPEVIKKGKAEEEK
jgi:large subunit ribosomal protein L25